MVKGGETVTSSWTARVASPNRAVTAPPPMPPKGSGRGTSIRCSAALQTEREIMRYGEPGSMMALRVKLQPPPTVRKRTRAVRRMIRLSMPSERSCLLSLISNRRLTRIKLQRGRNQPNGKFFFTCLLVSQSFNLCQIFPSGNRLLVHHSNPLIGTFLCQFIFMLEQPLLVLKIPLRYWRRYRGIGGPVFRNNTHRHLPRLPL